MDADSLISLDPIIDIHQFVRAVQENNDWFDALRSEGTRKGLRDSLEHHPTSISVQQSKHGDGPWKVEAYLVSAEAHKNLLDPIPSMVSEICSMFTAVHESFSRGESYEKWIIPYGDCILTTGNDDDWTGYWPEIVATNA